MASPLDLAHSPCPNDTFVFHAWTAGLLPGVPSPEVTIADIDVTNGMAARGELDVLKISYGALPHVLDRYALLPCGGALGHGCGPLLLTRTACEPADLAGRVVAIPTERSTAYLLFRLWAREALPGQEVRTVVMPFERIMPAVRDGEVDAGLVIHEARFTYDTYGLHRLVDLGEAWEERTGLPIPLGAIVARRDLGPERLTAITEAVRASVRHAWADPEASRDHVRSHAQEIAPEVQKQHIELYVNEYTEDLGADGLAAVRVLLDRAVEAGAVPAFPPGALDPVGSAR
ncbi:MULTISPECIES: 1,4-dihydroxy-6-naphthoate synthase [unclassified Streptomyces]|uniref:1,4-dihydroxy-6-naphthoate synthase n=1 Tax=unclassified Streptomyces TaxID=2593676 RepID=UPI00035C6319|nr:MULTISPECIES: 1,4-dihydroxy-6-naphthoate synthase [unclassified Streptomyces]MYY02433.1 ABC transporter substrate-binding protein [Streptomyces sp. SID4913]